MFVAEVEEVIPKEILLLGEKRLDAKKNKDYDTADGIRKWLAEHGYNIEDTADGFKISRIS